VIYFSFGKGQTGGGPPLRPAGEPFHRECRGSADGEAEADPQAKEERETKRAIDEAAGRKCQPGVSAQAAFGRDSNAAHLAQLSGGRDVLSGGRAPSNARTGDRKPA